MHSPFRILTPPDSCTYLPDQVRSLEYEFYQALTPSQYMARMRQGWRRFGYAVFHPQCPECRACQSLRVDVRRRFQPTRSQRRVRRMNEGAIRLAIGTPSVTPAKLHLHDRYHRFQAELKDWPLHESETEEAYRQSFVDNPFPTCEFSYYLDDELVGVGYVDDLPGGLSAIYFFYAPEHRERSLGTWNVLCVLEQAAQRGISYVYLGYFVAGCRSMEYKAKFAPNQVLAPDGHWRDFQV